MRKIWWMNLITWLAFFFWMLAVVVLNPLVIQFQSGKDWWVTSLQNGAVLLVVTVCWKFLRRWFRPNLAEWGTRLISLALVVWVVYGLTSIPMIFRVALVTFLFGCEVITEIYYRHIQKNCYIKVVTQVATETWEHNFIGPCTKDAAVSFLRSHGFQISDDVSTSKNGPEVLIGTRGPNANTKRQQAFFTYCEKKCLLGKRLELITEASF